MKLSFVRARAFLALPALLACLVATVPAQAETVRESHYVMGTLLEVTVEAPGRAAGQKVIRDAVGLARRLDGELSSWQPDGDLWKLNLAAGRGPQTVPPSLHDVLALASRISEATGGAFDVTVAAVMDPPVEIPTLQRPEDPSARRACIDWRAVHTTAPDHVSLEHACTLVDLGGIGKGFAAGAMARMLTEAGVASGVVNFGQSSVVVLGPPAELAPEVVAVRRGGQLVGTLHLRDLSLSTSESLVGDAGEEAEAALPHIVDPRSGELVRASRLAVVVAADAAVAEGWSTALVVDPEAVLERANALDYIEAMVLDDKGRRTTDGFDAASGWQAAAE